MLRASLIPTLLVSYALVAQTPATPKVQKLSLQDAIQTSLQNNLQVEIIRENRKAIEASTLINEGAFDWKLTSDIDITKIEDASRRQSFPGGPFASSSTTSYSRNVSIGSTKLFEWGGNLKLNYAPSYGFTKGNINDGPTTPFTTNPYDGSFSATYTQSLLQGFGRNVTEANLIIARKGSEAASYTFQQQIIDLVASTESLYWDVVYAQRNLENKKQSLALAQKQLKENKIRVEVGTLATIEVTSAEAQVALREQDIIGAETQFQNAKDALIRALYPLSDRPGDLNLTDAPTLSHISLDEPAAVKMALERRMELKVAKLNLESTQVQETVAQNSTLPTLNAFATYYANAASQIPNEGLSAVNKDITSNKYPGYTVGLQFSMPIMNRSAKGTLAKARASRRSSELNLRDKELGIILEVRTALRNVEAAQKGVKAAETTRIFREKDLGAEQKKFDNGMSTNFLVLSKQNDLDTAKSSELQAQISYAKAVTALEKSLGNLMEARKLEIAK